MVLRCLPKAPRTVLQAISASLTPAATLTAKLPHLSTSAHLSTSGVNLETKPQPYPLSLPLLEPSFRPPVPIKALPMTGDDGGGLAQAVGSEYGLGPVIEQALTGHAPTQDGPQDPGDKVDNSPADGCHMVNESSTVASAHHGATPTDNVPEGGACQPGDEASAFGASLDSPHHGDTPTDNAWLKEDLPFQGPIEKMDRTPTATELASLLEKAISCAQVFSNIKNDNTSDGKHQSGPNNGNGTTDEVQFEVQPLEDPGPQVDTPNPEDGSETGHAGFNVHGSSCQTPEEPTPQGPQLSLGRLQGIVNNLRGFQGELLTAHSSPNVVAVSKRFYTTNRNSYGAEHEAAKAGQQAQKKQKKRDKSKLASSGRNSYESEHEAAKAGQQEEKKQKKRDKSKLDPKPKVVNGPATPGRTEDVDEPESRLIAGVEVDVVAQGGCTWIEVKNQELFTVDSVHWTGTEGSQGSQGIKGLKRQAKDLLEVAVAECNLRRWQAPSVVIFFPSGVDLGVERDLTAMGINVVAGPAPPPEPTTTNLDVTTMCALVSELCRAKSDDPIVEECVAVAQFQKLMDMFSGPKEQERWSKLLLSMEVYTPLSIAISKQEAQVGVVNEAVPTYEVPRRLAALEKVGALQKDVFGLGYTRRAMTVTANGNAVFQLGVGEGEDKIRKAHSLSAILAVCLHSKGNGSPTHLNAHTDTCNSLMLQLLEFCRDSNCSFVNPNEKMVCGVCGDPKHNRRTCIARKLDEAGATDKLKVQATRALMKKFVTEEALATAIEAGLDCALPGLGMSIKLGRYAWKFYKKA
eukprot:gene11297-18933_t